jgi:hypothetical protein
MLSISWSPEKLRPYQIANSCAAEEAAKMTKKWISIRTGRFRENNKNLRKEEIMTNDVGCLPFFDDVYTTFAVQTVVCRFIDGFDADESSNSRNSFNLGAIIQSHLSCRARQSFPTSLPSHSLMSGLLTLSL